MIVLSLLGGVLADSVNKRNIMVGLDFLTAVIMMGFYFIMGIAPIIPLFIVTPMLLYGISGTYQPAVQASIQYPDVSRCADPNSCIFGGKSNCPYTQEIFYRS